MIFVGSSYFNWVEHSTNEPVKKSSAYLLGHNRSTDLSFKLVLGLIEYVTFDPTAIHGFVLNFVWDKAYGGAFRFYGLRT